MAVIMATPALLKLVVGTGVLGAVALAVKLLR
jgi:hypothetical protein